MQKTTMLKKEAIDQSRVWYHIDASGLILGKLAVAIADLLRGKNKVNFTSHVDCGDHVIVTNANKVILSKDKNKKEF
jgi:large subunit ribosomal protein L13